MNTQGDPPFDLAKIRSMLFNPALHRTVRWIQRPESPAFEQIVQETISPTLKNLMSDRGLYQKQVCDLGALEGIGIVPAPKTAPPPPKRTAPTFPAFKGTNPTRAPKTMSLEVAIREAEVRPWIPDLAETNASQIVGHALPQGSSEIYQQSIPFRVLSFPSQCQRCKTSIFAVRFIHQDGSTFPKLAKGGLVQIWHLYCRCEHCKEFETVLSVQRIGLRLTLVGRSERYVPPVHKLIDEAHRGIVGDAISAANEADVFAAFYHIRTFVEHFMKAAIGEPVDSRMDGETLCSKYNETLDPRMKNGLPSLTPVYSELSQRMHSRTGDRGHFESALTTIHDHLEAKAMFEKHKAD